MCHVLSVLLLLQTVIFKEANFRVFTPQTPNDDQYYEVILNDDRLTFSGASIIFHLSYDDLQKVMVFDDTKWTVAIILSNSVVINNISYDIISFDVMNMEPDHPVSNCAISSIDG